MKINVGKNTKRNIVIGFINRLVLLILPFITRTVINLVLGIEYLGLNSLFSSIIQVLSLTELGFSTVLVYHMYEPIANDNQEKINALLNLYKKAYRIVGITLLVLGGLVFPFLPSLIHGTYPQSINIYVLFGIYLINTSISYFVYGYKQSLLVAFQRNDLDSIINLVVQTGLQACQIILLFTTHNYYYYALCMPIFTVINNFWIGLITKRIFPWAKAKGKLDKDTIHDIKLLVSGAFISRACILTRNSLDSICISAYLGLALTGIYNNYYMILNGLTSFLAIVSTALSGGIGNHVATKSVSENFDELRKLDFLYMMISGFSAVCLLCLYQAFMKIWMGVEMLLPFGAVILLVTYYYVLKMGDIRSIYSGAKGLWWKMKWRSIFETLGNLVLNIVLGKIYGVYGIILATLISLFFCNFVWSSHITFCSYFGLQRWRSFLYYHLKYFLVTAVVCMVTYVVSNILINLDNPVTDLVVKGIVSVLLSAGLYLLVYFKSEIFKQSILMVNLGISKKTR